ncbi:hypothetical protein LAZ67_17001536 [Cordylochernes scorpioides]|uniref:Mos1 transposase HTH domain-containing protein n=1 Tax=Cordylochernes scorpioides TaxID=51811 RepID=A0ABY6LDI3_9ARAC|nr:hypothetical protein LAZ67_17001536 [Cordylochernes scorpioides]
MVPIVLIGRSDLLDSQASIVNDDQLRFLSAFHIGRVVTWTLTTQQLDIIFRRCPTAPIPTCPPWVPRPAQRIPSSLLYNWETAVVVLVASSSFSSAMFKLMTLCALVGVALCDPLLAPQPYAFGFATGDLGGHSRSESGTGDGTVSGKYSYVDPNGNLRTVSYRAGPGIGFQPSGDISVDRVTAQQAAALAAQAPRAAPAAQVNAPPNLLAITLTIAIRCESVITVFWIVFDFYLFKKMDQRTCFIFCVKNEIKCADAFRMLTVAYGEATLDRSNVYRWNKMFSEGREDVNDEERAGRPSTSTIDEKIIEVEKMILANRRITVREVAEDLNISIGSCHSIFINDLGMKRVAAIFVPKLLNCDQKQHRMNIANEMLASVRDDPNLLQRVITGDEAWVYGYDVETKAQSSQWKLPHEPRPKKVRQVRSNVKVLLTVFFDCRGVVHHEVLPQGRRVNKEHYLQVMRNLREAIRQKSPGLWKNKIWLLHHDNAPAHTSLLVRDLLAKNNTLMMPQPPHSPDLAPCDFFLFPKLKRPMKGRRYATLDEIKTASKEELKKIFKNYFLKCFEDCKNRWHKCIISHGDYFEGDKICINE